MKKVSILIAMLFAVFYGYSQDRIIKKDKSEIKAKILEIGETEIKYKKEENSDGPTYTIKKAEVNVVIYKNGQVESFNEVAVSSTTLPIKNTVAISNQNYIKETKVTKSFKSYVANANDSKLTESFEKFKSARTTNLVFSGVVFVGAVSYLVALFVKPKGKLATGYAAPVAMIGLTVVNLTVLMPKFKKATKTFLNDYNNHKASKSTLKLGFTNNGIGLALNF